LERKRADGAGRHGGRAVVAHRQHGPARRGHGEQDSPHAQRDLLRQDQGHRQRAALHSADTRDQAAAVGHERDGQRPTEAPGQERLRPTQPRDTSSKEKTTKLLIQS